MRFEDRCCLFLVAIAVLAMQARAIVMCLRHGPRRLGLGVQHPLLGQCALASPGGQGGTGAIASPSGRARRQAVHAS